MSDYSDIVAQIEKRNAQRQEEWRAKALARRKQGGKVARGSELSFGVEMDDDDIDELPAHRRRRLRNQHLIPDDLFVSLPNDTLYNTMCFLWGGEMASCSQVCRELYNVVGETVVSGFLQHFGGRHPRRMMRNVLFRMYEKVRVRSMSNLKGIMLWSSHHGYLRAVRNCIADERWHSKLKVRRPSDGATPLFLAAEQNNLPIVRALCARGVEINLGTFEGFSPLHAAAREGHSSVARFLIDAKADLTKTDSSGYSPMMLAAGQGHAKIVRLLAEAGVRVDVATKIFKSDADQGGETALHRACEKGHAEMVGLLLDMDKSGSMINSVTGQGRTPLITAAEEGQKQCVGILLEKGANVHITTKAGKGALYLACERGHVEIVKQLLEAGADPGQYTCRKKIPLYTAAEQGNLAMVKVLLPFTTKAHLFIETTYGTTPLFIATRSGNGDVKDILVDFCSRGKKKKRGVNASLAKEPTTPRYMSDIDPVGEKERARRKRERERVNASHAAARARVEAERAQREAQEGTSDLRSSRDRAKYALEARGRNPRDNFAPDDVDTTDYLANPSGNPNHNVMAERGRARRRERENLLRQEEEKLQAEAARRASSRNKAKKRRWLREREAAARRKQQEILDEENKAKRGNSAMGEAPAKNDNSPQDDFDDGDLSSDTDSDEEQGHKLGKKDINAFMKRQEEAERRKAEKVERAAEALRQRDAKRWQTVTPTIEGGQTGDLALPPSAPDQSTIAGTGSRAAQALARAREALGEPSYSPRAVERQQIKPKVVSLGL